jgi:hypothetical protein
MRELNAIQQNILRSLTFPEPFETLLEEVAATPPVIGAELKSLIAKGWVQVMHAGADGRFKPSFYYDSDNMRAFHYQASSKGLEMLGA